MPTRWIPTEVLQFDPNYSGFTCMGFAPSKGRKCRNPIACANRQGAAKLLLEMSGLHPQSQRVDCLLEELASRLLCRRWHQDQAAGITRQWQDDIDNHQAAEDDRRCERIVDLIELRLTAAAVRAERSVILRTPPAPARSTVARPRETSHRTNQPTASVARLRIQDSVTPSEAASVQSRERDHNEPSGEESEQQSNSEPDLSSQQRAFLRDTIDHGNNPPTRSPTDELNTHTPDASHREQIVTTREAVTDDAESEEHATEVPAQEHSQEESPHAHDRGAIEVTDEGETEGHILEAPTQEHPHEESLHAHDRRGIEEVTEEERTEEHTPEAPTQELPHEESLHAHDRRVIEEVTNEGEPEDHAIEAPTRDGTQEEPPHAHDRRAIEGDCCICFEDLSSGGDTAWCKAQCRQNFHADCIDTWHASQVANRRAMTCPHCRTQWAE